MVTWVGTSTTADKSWSNDSNWVDDKGAKASAPLTYQDATFNNGAIVDLPSSFSTSGTLTVNGTVTFQNTGSAITFGKAVFSANSTLALNGVHATLSSFGSANGTGTVTLENGAFLSSSYGNAVAPVVVFKHTTDANGKIVGNTLSVDFNGGSTNQLPSIQNLSVYDRIVIANTNDTAITLNLTDNGNGTYSLIETIPAWGNATRVISSNVTLAEGLSASDFTFEVENGNTDLVCYLPGSMIRTPAGDVAVEHLHPGDMLVAYANGQSVARAVVWVGRKHMTVQTHLPEADAGYPVRVKANAIADGVPYKDMLITPEHCLFLDGVFVPVRMLVNGGSIAYDHTITAYDYYHVETQQHSVIMADGALTESYLDTGNRGSFRQDGTVVTLGGRHLSWEHDAAAPLETTQPVVEKLFHALAARAGVATGTQALVEDDNLHLVTETGAVVRKLRTQAGRVSFMLPPGVQSVTVVSRASKPCDVVGPFVNDRRMLGVQIGAVTAISATDTQTSTAHLQADALAGWHGMEAGASARWTNGQATLPLHGLTGAGMTILTLDVVSAGPYLADTSAAQQDVLCA